MLLQKLMLFLMLACTANSADDPPTDGGFSLTQSTMMQTLSGFRRWWAQLWPAAAPIGVQEMEADDRKMHYGYTDHNGPNSWSLEYPLCGGNHQSPVDLTAKRMRRAAGNPLHWTSPFWHTPTNMTLRNSGHTVELAADWSPKAAPELRGGPLQGSYTFWQMHFHWGTHDNQGSEHTVNNQSFPMEVHAVHYKTEYVSPRRALTYPDGLAVIGFLFQMSSRTGASLVPLTPSLPRVRAPGSSANITPVPLSSILSPPRAYATYQGSLTTPPCSEGVTWLVSGSSLPVSKEQLHVFRTLASHDGEMGDNFRPIQPLNGRSLFYVS